MRYVFALLVSSTFQSKEDGLSCADEFEARFCNLIVATYFHIAVIRVLYNELFLVNCLAPNYT